MSKMSSLAMEVDSMKYKLNVGDRIKCKNIDEAVILADGLEDEKIFTTKVCENDNTFLVVEKVGD